MEDKLYESAVNAVNASEINDELREYILTALRKTCKGRMVQEIHCDEYFCPVCGSENLCDEYEIYDKYCPECGQKLIIPGNEEEAY